MQVTKIQIQNFRLLKDLTVDLGKDLSIILGKNNCGKTSVLLILNKFLSNHSGKTTFTFDDFNMDFKEDLKSRIEGPGKDSRPFSFSGISLKLFIEYDEQDDLSNIGNKVIMDLDPANKLIVLAFKYYMSEEKFDTLKRDYQDQKAKKLEKAKDLFSFLRDRHANYFQISKKSIYFDRLKQQEDENISTDLIKENIRIDKIISFKSINARRNVSNKDSDKALSLLSSKFYKKMEASKRDLDIIEKFKDTLSETDKQLDGFYEKIFQEVIEHVKKFGGIQKGDSTIRIISSLQHKELLEENATVMYALNNPEHSLPESYNGLGYMNLISMIFEIKILLHEFQGEEEEKPADINLLFIEEPEVHTHPQMQCIFIKNIKYLLKMGIIRKDGEVRSIQTILSTHSSHIVSEGEFEDIKYFKKQNGGVVSKNLKDLEREYSGSEQYYKFLKQYLTLHRSELFFAEKSIFIEGDTERMLLPAMIKKIDQEDFSKEFVEGDSHSLPLFSQNISIIEVGAYSQVFEKFMDFIGIKSLIITDIDSVKMVSDGGTERNKACPVLEGSQTSNTSLRFFYRGKDLNGLSLLPLEQKILRKDPISKEWVQHVDGHLFCTYQTKEIVDDVEYHARSFEDAFFHVNKQFVSEQKFPSLTQEVVQKFAESKIDAWEMAQKVKSKTSFAMEVLLNSRQENTILKSKTGKSTEIVKQFTNWNIPFYISEGLRWLKQD